jgi:acyl dehydratase
MPINRDFLGRTFPPSDPYEISRVKIRDFADAIGDPSPVFRDVAAAQAAGYPDVIAPPTFPIVITAAAGNRAATDPELGVNYAMVVHGEQSFAYVRPMVAGDVVTAQTTITDIRDAGRNTLLTNTTEFRTLDGELVCTAHSTLVERGGAG